MTGFDGIPKVFPWLLFRLQVQVFDAREAEKWWKFDFDRHRGGLRLLLVLLELHAQHGLDGLVFQQQQQQHALSLQCLLPLVLAARVGGHALLQFESESRKA